MGRDDSNFRLQTTPKPSSAAVYGASPPPTQPAKISDTKEGKNTALKGFQEAQRSIAKPSKSDDLDIV